MRPALSKLVPSICDLAGYPAPSRRQRLGAAVIAPSLFQGGQQLNVTFQSLQCGSHLPLPAPCSLDAAPITGTTSAVRRLLPLWSSTGAARRGRRRTARRRRRTCWRVGQGPARDDVGGWVRGQHGTVLAGEGDVMWVSRIRWNGVGPRECTTGGIRRTVVGLAGQVRSVAGESGHGSGKRRRRMCCERLAEGERGDRASLMVSAVVDRTTLTALPPPTWLHDPGRCPAGRHAVRLQRRKRRRGGEAGEDKRAWVRIPGQEGVGWWAGKQGVGRVEPYPPVVARALSQHYHVTAG